jgi:NAD-dependent SIR2 family protein deacetylase
MKYEYCCKCGCATGKAGASEDSLYTEADGPFCEDCYPEKQAQQRTWVGLTDVEWMNIVNKNQAWFGMQPDEVAHEVCKLTEAKLKEKNT